MWLGTILSPPLWRPCPLYLQGPTSRLLFPRPSARAWIAAEEGERLAFYSAAGGVENPNLAQASVEEPKKRPAPKAKRHTNAQLAEQIGTLVDLIPALTQQMQDLSARQTALEKKAAVPSPPLVAHQPAHRQPFPLSGSLCLPRTP